VEWTVHVDSSKVNDPHRTSPQPPYMLRATAYALLLAGITTAASPTATHMSAVSVDTLGHFPSVEGRNLDDRPFDLPADFEGDLNVVLVAFSRGQQADVDSWMPFLESVTEPRHNVRVYELPTIGRGYRLMRSFIDGGMRRGIPDPAVRAATITLYIDKAPFRDSLRLRDEDRIHVLLVDRRGAVHWRAEGRFDPHAGAELVRRIDEPRATTGGVD
jgi:hypothetical protein